MNMTVGSLFETIFVSPLCYSSFYIYLRFGDLGMPSLFCQPPVIWITMLIFVAKWNQFYPNFYISHKQVVAFIRSILQAYFKPRGLLAFTVGGTVFWDWMILSLTVSVNPRMRDHVYALGFMVLSNLINKVDWRIYLFSSFLPSPLNRQWCNTFYRIIVYSCSHGLLVYCFLTIFRKDECINQIPSLNFARLIADIIDLNPCISMEQNNRNSWIP